ncbi:MAG: hypothetical protein EHM36_11645 [Deltaproteobacteria bacterium]|nr:MAG: hypothetical protein EHM36_11645 [Deltaproteobacteria bacterium]
MVTATPIKHIKKTIETHLRSGELELVVLPKAEYEALLQRLDDLEDIHDSIESLKEYQAGKRTSFDDYDARRKTKRV